MRARNELARKRYANGLDYKNNPTVSKGHSLEQKLIWQYLFDASDLPLHIRRTLDQYGYPSLDNTSRRDKDQVVYKAMLSRAENVKNCEVSKSPLNLPPSSLLQTRPQVGVNLTPEEDKIKVLM